MCEAHIQDAPTTCRRTNVRGNTTKEVLYIMKTVIQTPKAPAAIGPYSQAIAVGDMIYTSGMIPIIPETGELETGDVKAQAKQAIGN